MVHIRRRSGKFFVEIRKRYGQKIYGTFDRLSDARSFAKETELGHSALIELIHLAQNYGVMHKGGIVKKINTQS